MSNKRRRLRSDATSLAPKAFAIFANQIDSEIANENASLKAENSRLCPLRDRLNSVEIRVDGNVVVSCKLDEAVVGLAADGEGRLRLAIPRERWPAIPFEKCRRQ